MSSRSGLSTTWYSYNLPNTINGPSSNSSQFFYGPDRARWKQVASYAGTSEQTIYIGGLVEKVTLGGATHWKHYVAGGTGVVVEYVRHSTGTNETVYLLKDHLGSTEMVTNSSGAQMSRLSYDAWGRRRNGGVWNGNPAASAWTTITNTTRHGFTSHEMLDNLSLVHMNGRVYDQVLGRFLRADSFIDGAGSTQGWNRYAYVQSNPVSFTDPSGYTKKIISWINGQSILDSGSILDFYGDNGLGGGLNPPEFGGGGGGGGGGDADPRDNGDDNDGADQDTDEPETRECTLAEALTNILNDFKRWLSEDARIINVSLTATGVAGAGTQAGFDQYSVGFNFLGQAFINNSVPADGPGQMQGDALIAAGEFGITIGYTHGAIHTGVTESHLTQGYAAWGPDGAAFGLEHSTHGGGMSVPEVSRRFNAGLMVGYGGALLDDDIKTFWNATAPRVAPPGPHISCQY